MSTQIDVYYGYGFDYNNVDTLKVPDFLRNHVDAIRKSGYEAYADLVTSDIADESVLADEADAIDPMYGWSCGGFCGIVAEIIRVETGLNIGAYSDSESGDCSIMWVQCYPWELNEKEKKLTRDDMDNLFKPYLTELGIDGDADYCHVEVIG